MNIHDSIITMLDAGSYHVNSLKSEIEEANVFLASKHYTQEERDSIVSKASEQIDDIVEASDVLVNFLQILGRHSRAKTNMTNAKMELISCLDLES